jgi:bifunctional DNA-binding transcriptional regulator/antitoxin component of YhaV-PrlF toxin-antitoxin module
MGLEDDAEGWENSAMSATMVGEKRQTTLPADVCEAAGLEPGDQVDWAFQDGVIRGKKLARESVEVLDIEDVDPETLAPKEGTITSESITKAIRADRESQR